MAAGLVPQAIVLALGAGVLGGHDALRILLELAGHGTPTVDLAVCIVFISVVTVYALGTLLLARFVRKARASGGAVGALATDLFAHVTATVSVGIASLVTACLLIESGGVGWARHLLELGAKNPVVTGTALAIVAGAATGFLPCTMPLLRFFRWARNASGGATTKPAEHTRRSGKIASLAFVGFSLACILLVIWYAPLGRVADGGEHTRSA